MSESSNNKIKYINLAGALFIFFILGINYTVPNYAPYLASYFNYLNGGPGQFYTSIMMTLGTVGYNLGQIAHIYVDKLIEGKFMLAIIIESLLACILLYLCSVFENVAAIITMQTLSIGFLNGLIYYTMITSMWKTFPEIKSKITGASLVSLAIAPSFYNTITHHLVNPNDVAASHTVFEKGLEVKYFEKEIFLNITNLYQYFALINLGLFTIGIFLQQYSLILEKKEQQKLQFNDSNFQKKQLLYDYNQVQLDNENETVDEIMEEQNPLNILKRSQFWQVFFIFLFGLFTFSFMLRNYKFYGLTLRNDKDFFLTQIESAASIIQGLSRLLWGVLAEKYSAKQCLIVVFFGQILTYISYYFFQDIYIFGTVFLFMFILYGGYVVCGMCFVLQTFDKQISVKAIPLLSFSGIIVGNLVTLNEKFVVEQIGYRHNFLMVGLSGFIALLLVYFYRYQISRSYSK